MGRKKSLIEETLERQEVEQQVAARFQSLPGEINPLRPPGYMGPSYGPSPWLYMGIGAALLVVMRVILVVALSGSG